MAPLDIALYCWITLISCALLAAIYYRPWEPRLWSVSDFVQSEPSDFCPSRSIMTFDEHRGECLDENLKVLFPQYSPLNPAHAFQLQRLGHRTCIVVTTINDSVHKAYRVFRDSRGDQYQVDEL